MGQILMAPTTSNIEGTSKHPSHERGLFSVRSARSRQLIARPWQFIAAKTERPKDQGQGHLAFAEMKKPGDPDNSPLTADHRRIRTKP